MVFFKKLSSVLGTDPDAIEKAALEKLNGLTKKIEERLNAKVEKEEKYDEDEDFDEENELDEDEDFDEENELDEDEDIDEVEEDEEEDEEEVENRQKPIFVIRLKRFEAPLTPLDVAEHKDDFESTGSTCVLMRDKEDDPDQAHCFFGAPAYGLMNKAIAALWSWNDGEEEPIEPVVDYLVEAKCYNDSVHPDTIDDVAYYIVNEFGKQSWDITGEFPYSDSLIRVINEVDGGKYRYDFVAYKGYSGINDDDEGWVDKMISYHHIDL